MNRQRITRFSRYVFETYRLPHDMLAAIVRAQDRYSPLFRVAAVRHIVADAPLAVTGGRPFAERRRAVRRFYRF